MAERVIQGGPYCKACGHSELYHFPHTGACFKMIERPDDETIVPMCDCFQYDSSVSIDLMQND
jgi:hypothetical protein